MPLAFSPPLLDTLSYARWMPPPLLRALLTLRRCCYITDADTCYVAAYAAMALVDAAMLPCYFR